MTTQQRKEEKVVDPQKSPAGHGQRRKVLDVAVEPQSVAPSGPLEGV